MQPKIVKAEKIAAFHLPSGYVASLLGNIESAGIIQYYYVMAVFGPDEQPCLFTASEWSDLDPSYKEEPVFGVFNNEGHAALGRSADWKDPALFVLRSIDYVKEHFKIDDTKLCEGEAWALTQLLKGLQDALEGITPYKDSYQAALSRNDSRLLDYMNKHKAS